MRPAGHQWGREECLANWLASGGTRARWHGRLWRLVIPDMDASEIAPMIGDDVGSIRNAPTTFTALETTGDALIDRATFNAVRVQGARR